MRASFNTDVSNVDGISMRINWPQASRKDSSYDNWQRMKTIGKII